MHVVNSIEKIESNPKDHETQLIIRIMKSTIPSVIYIYSLN